MDEISVRPTILVVDDQETVRRILEMRLTKAGFQVILAADGQEALERFNADSQAVSRADCDAFRAL